MDERSYDVDAGGRIEPKKKAKPYRAPKRETIKLQLARDVKLNATGKVTGKLYTFNGAGAILDVDKEDAEIMLKRKVSGCCPGSTGSTPYFQIIE